MNKPLLLVSTDLFMGKNRVGVFVCACGKTFRTTIDHVRRGHTKSCGCLTKKVNHSLYFKHGESGRKTNEYRTWDAMIQRCTNPKTKGWKWYGARGIKVCRRWRTNYTNFLKDMGRRPDGFSIDRVNNNGDYTPMNCRWATASQQNSNKRSTI